MLIINRILIVIIMIVLVSCKKEKKGCLINKTGYFYVENQSKDTADFILIQNTDTTRETILPYRKYEYFIKAGVVTKTYLYRADTLYRKTMDNWKIQRCGIDGHFIR
jgi:hypothetical protein